MKRLDRTKRNLFLSLGLLFSLATAAVTTTYAWFAVRQMDIQQTEFLSGRMGINLVDATAYKFVYPVYEGTTLPNYDSDQAGVGSQDITGVTSPTAQGVNGYLTLNKLDTTQIYFDNNASTDITESNLRTAIAAQNTSILLEVHFTAVNTEDVAFTLIANRANADNFDYTNTTNNLADMSLLSSDFLCFNTFVDLELSADIDTDEELWAHFRTLHGSSAYSNRRFFHQDVDSHGKNLIVHESTLEKNPSTTPVTHTAYILIEYEPTHIAPYLMNVERLRYNYHLTSDFTFTLQVSSEVNS